MSMKPDRDAAELRAVAPALLEGASAEHLAELAGVDRRTARAWQRAGQAPLAVLRLLALHQRGDFAALAGAAWSTFELDRTNGAIRSPAWRAGITGADVIELAGFRAERVAWQIERRALESRAQAAQEAAQEARRRLEAYRRELAELRVLAAPPSRSASPPGAPAGA